MIQASDGNFYGMAGPSFNSSVETTQCVFSLTPSGSFRALYIFGQGSDGKDPLGTVVQGPNGDLYGLTIDGGTAGHGILFEISTDGKLIPSCITLATVASPMMEKTLTKLW